MPRGIERIPFLCGKDAGREAYFFIQPLLLYQARALS